MVGFFSGRYGLNKLPYSKGKLRWLPVEYNLTPTRKWKSRHISSLFYLFDMGKYSNWYWFFSLSEMYILVPIFLPNIDFQDLHVVKLLSASHPTGTQSKILTLKPDKLMSSILCQNYLNISCVRESVEPPCFLNRGVWRGYVKVFCLICHDSTSVGLVIALSRR